MAFHLFCVICLLLFSFSFFPSFFECQSFLARGAVRLGCLCFVINVKLGNLCLGRPKVVSLRPSFLNTSHSMETTVVIQGGS